MSALSPDLLLGEWACLGVIAAAPAHGYVVAKRFGKDGDLGRVWTLSRPMTYRCLDVLQEQGLVEAVPGSDASDARSKTVLRATATGRRALHRWLDEPVPRLRDVRTDLLMKLLISKVVGRSPDALIAGQRTMVRRRRAELEAELTAGATNDPVIVWRAETAAALERTLRRLGS